MKILQLPFLCFTVFILTANDNIELTISGSQQTKMPLAIFIPQETDKTCQKIAHIIKKDLLFVDQFEPSIKTYNSLAMQKELRKNIQLLANSGIPLALFINAKPQEAIEYHLYDTMQCLSLSAKKLKKKERKLSELAHIVADEIRKTLTSNDFLFSSKIAYCKKDTQTNTSKIYIADFDGSNEKLIVNSCGMAIAPRWHRKEPEIFYSEYTSTQMELYSISVKNKKEKNKKNHKKNSISPFENGVNMFVDIAPNGKDYLFCASQGNGNCQIYLHKDGNIKRCTNNTGNNDCPIFIDDERICFCSDFQTGSPQIYIGNIVTGHLQRITYGGYCTSPTYCAKKNQIAYHKMINGIMQIMIYDCTAKTHIQLTYDSGNKHNVSWSSDGAFLLYAHEGYNNSSRIEKCNILSKKTKYVTKSDEYCNYPHWSPAYKT